MNCNFTCGYGTIITIFALLALILININNNFDIVYAHCWLDTIDPIYDSNNPNANNMQISIGNHENSGSEDLNTYLDAFSLTRQFGQVYSFNFHNVHFLSMATEISYSTGSSQNVFVKNDLAAAAANPNIDWIIVYFHKPMYSSPSSCSSCSGESSLRYLSPYF